LSRDRTVVGEPVSLRLHVQGAGNFDRVNSAMLTDAIDRKTYRTTSMFVPAEATGFRGDKVFEQSLVATQPGTQVLPPLEFSYFDPQTRRYQIARAAPLRLEVAPAPSVAAPVAATTPPTDPAPHAMQDTLTMRARGDHAAPAPEADSLIPLYLQPRSLSVPVLLIVGITGVWFRRVHRDPATPGGPAASRQSSTGELLLQMERAASGGDSAQFFRSASHALRHAGVIDHDAEAREILRLVDEANYAGELPPGADLQRCRRMVIRCLAARGLA
jgi:hypothetical protein